MDRCSPVAPGPHGARLKAGRGADYYSQFRIDNHRDAQDPTKPYLALQKNAERTFVAQAGLIGEGVFWPENALRLPDVSNEPGV